MILLVFHVFFDLQLIQEVKWSLVLGRLIQEVSLIVDLRHPEGLGDWAGFGFGLWSAFKTFSF